MHLISGLNNFEHTFETIIRKPLTKISFCQGENDKLFVKIIMGKLVIVIQKYFDDENTL